MNKVQQKFIDRGDVILQSDGKWFIMPKITAMEFIEACKKENIVILGIDGFYLREKGIQPSMDNSIDFSSISYKGSKDFYSESVKFLSERDDTMYFEIVCAK